MMLVCFSPNNKLIEQKVTSQTVIRSALLDSLYMIEMFYLDLSYHIIIISYKIAPVTKMFTYIPI